MLNRLFALILLILFSPFFFLVSILILLEDGFPLLFTQKRVGINYTFFKIYKFRSMKKDTPNVATHLLINPDQYLLKIGKFLRKTSLDELPNLINIIKGEMVFVGPRPAPASPVLFRHQRGWHTVVRAGVELRCDAGLLRQCDGLHGFLNREYADADPLTRPHRP